MIRKELYKFTCTNNNKVYTFTSSLHDITYKSVVYKAIPIGRANIKVTNEINKSDMVVNFDLKNEFANQWLTNVIDDIVIFELLIAESDNDFDAIYSSSTDITVTLAWRGRLTLSSSDDIINLTFEDNFSKLKRSGARRVYSRLCPYILYAEGCRVKMYNYIVPDVKIINIVGTTCTIDNNILQNYPGNYFVGGILRLVDDTMLYILKQNNDNLVLSRIPKSLSKTINKNGFAIVSLYPGCDRSQDTCHNKFNNVYNYGGFRYMTTKQIFTKSIL